MSKRVGFLRLNTVKQAVALLTLHKIATHKENGTVRYKIVKSRWLVESEAVLVEKAKIVRKKQAERLRQYTRNRWNSKDCY